MAAVANDVLIAQFEAIFRDPTLDAMMALSPDDFQRFIKYVFECAGYPVEYVADLHFPHGPGVDLNLHSGSSGESKVVAGVEVKRLEPGTPVSLHEVAAFIGFMNVAGDLPGYMVTTSDFTAAGYAAADATSGSVHLINGRRLLRYIAYVGGSRLTGTDAPKSQPVQRIAPTCLFQADAITRLDPLHTSVLAIANNKGGVAKTTTAAHIGIALAQQHSKRVLLVDMDGQGSLSHLLPLPGPRPPARPPEDTSFLSAFFAHKTNLSDLVRPTRFDNVWLIPADKDLFLLDRGAAGHPTDELNFVRALHASGLVAPDGQPFDWIILDTPPAQSFFTRAGLAAAHYILLPVHADALAVYGTDGALHTAATMRGLMGGGAQLIGAVPTRWKRTPEADKALVALADHLRSYGTRLISINIPDDAKVDKTIAKSEAGGISGIFQIGNTPGPAADAYKKLVQEALPHVNSH